ncbi:MAG: transposase, family [Clostridiales bacterium]|nr:transposase, family [Clostridiales bacterium]
MIAYIVSIVSIPTSATDLVAETVSAGCYIVCSDYEKYVCPHLSKPPYVCKACSDLKSCTLEKSTYAADDAQKEYKLCLSESRKGISIDE